MSIALERRRYMGARGGSPLPSGYTELSYIQNTSTAYIDTGINFNDGSVIATDYEFKYEHTSSSASIMSVQSGSTGRVGGVEVSGNLYLLAGGSSGASSTGISVLYTQEYYTYELDNVNGVVQFSVGDYSASKSFTAGTANNSNNFYLFCKNTDGTISNHILGRIYYYKIYIDGSLVRNFIPCANPDNEYGMYDTISRTFYSSPNGVAFRGGYNYLITNYLPFFGERRAA